VTEYSRPTIEELEQQDAEVVLDHFDQSDAFQLGMIAARLLIGEGTPLGVDIAIGDHLVFRVKLGGVSQDTDVWLAAKARVARHYDKASIHVRAISTGEGWTVEDHGLDPDLYRPHGGSVPIRVTDVGLVGTITVSGAHDTVDHALAMGALRAFSAGE
jgi:uncharacterized protein (UPF0303 family)